MRKIIPILLSSIIIIIITIIITINAVAMDDDQDRITGISTYDKLLQMAGEKGTARVIVKLDVQNIKKLTERSTQFQTVEPGLSFPAAGLQADQDLQQAIETTSYSVLHQLNGKTYRLNHLYETIPYLALEVSTEALNRLTALPQVLEIYEDKPRRLVDYPGEEKESHPGQPMLTTSVNLTGAKNAWSMGYTGSGWYVAILDTGIRRTHQFFTGKTIVEACFSALGDCPDGSTEMKGAGAAAHYEATYDGYDHGTHVAGIAAGKYGALAGVAKDSKIIAVQVFSRFSESDCGGTPCVMSYDSDQVKGLEYIYSLRSTYSIAAANMSLGGGSYSSYCNGEPQKAAMDNLKAVRIATVVAGGNDGYCGYISSPACIPAAVAVGASDDFDEEAGFNNWHPTLQELFAPGVNIKSSTGESDSSYASWDGTSMATPHVTGAWALLRQASSSSSVDNVLAALQATGPAVETFCGSGGSCPRIQVNSAIEYLLGYISSITITSPNGGEIWSVNSDHVITWTSSGFTGNVKIELSTNNGSKWTTITASTKNTGSYNWTVPNTPSTKCKIRIKDAVDGSPSDTGNATFTIVSGPAPTLTVISPNGQEKWETGSVHNITWSTTGSVGAVKIYYSTNNGSNWTTVAGSTANDGSHSWTVPNTISAACRVRIDEAADASPTDTSNAAFSIVKPEPPEISLNRTQFNYGSIMGGMVTGPQTLRIDNKGGGTLQWTALSDAPWLVISPASGNNSGEIMISTATGVLAPGSHTGTINVSATGATNTPQTVHVQLAVKDAVQDEAPIGGFDTPGEGVTVSGSIALTGWALDDVGIASVKIYRQSGENLIYVGDALTVEGARPDVESLYAGMPESYRGGWGYMLLTNFLPNGVNVLTVIATDLSGKQTTLGSKTVTVDNVNAVKPFGAIDNPAAGGEISGMCRNSGWVLTPLPNKIPTDGSTIKIYIDGVNKGHAVYNIYRPDIAGLFPGLLNSEGAHAYFNFNTASYGNGVHTIAWTAADNAGNAEGIGSRYFIVQNTSTDMARRFEPPCTPAGDTLSPIAGWDGAVTVTKGYREDVSPQRIYPGKNGIITIEIRELERLVIHFPASVINRSLLPIGSTLDSKKGIFYWQPGPGFIGNYEFVFTDNKGKHTNQININILPGQ